MSSLAIKTVPRRKVAKIINATLLLLLVACVARVFIWEHNYYQRMEGSTRSTAPATSDIRTRNVDESDVSKSKRKAHIVPPDQPRFLSIARLKVKNARIFAVGTFNDGQLKTPNNIFDIGWYQKSAKPGTGGTAVFDGHNGGPTKTGVFKHLISLTSDDIIAIEMGNGTIYRYRVVDNLTIPLNEADKYMSKTQVSPVPGQESISIISCIGEWSNTQQTYLSRQFVRAIRIK